MLGCLVLATWLGECSASASRYDSKIKAAWRRYVPTYDWRLGWAQLWQESRLNPEATSPVGAAGVGQFMPRTWQEMQTRGFVPHRASVRNVTYNIQASGAYMMMQLRGWYQQGRSYGSRYDLALASYNAGRGHLYKAQRLCNGAMEYQNIVVCLEQVTGRHSLETRDYVEKIHSHFTQRFKDQLWW